MSNILKEPYSISVWEEELIPVQDWYVTEDGEERISVEEYEAKTEEEREGYQLHTILEHYEETHGIIIGAHDMDSPYAAAQPIFKENVNGSIELTFTLYYKLFDPDLGDFAINPFSNLLANEAKVKLNYRGKWYDLIVKNRVEDSTNYAFTYTCKDLYINELNKNGFKVELDTELENNQGTVVELSKTILKDSDWEVDEEKSDLIVETKVEPLYIGKLNKNITVKKINDYTPDELVDTSEWPETTQINRGSHVLFFYSDIADNKENPQVLLHFYENEGNWIYSDAEVLLENYKIDVNEDIIINACNYEIISPKVFYIDSDIAYNIPNITEEALDIYDPARGEKVIKSQRSGYDPDLDKFIFKFFRKDDVDKVVEYYGYTETEVLRTDLAQNFLANSQNFITLEGGWYFDGVPSKTTKVKGKEKTSAYTGQIFQTTDSEVEQTDITTNTDSLLVLNLKAEGNEEYYPDSQGEYYLMKTPSYVDKNSDDGQKFAEDFLKMIKETSGLDTDDAEAAAEKLLADRLYRKETIDGKDKYFKDSKNGTYYLTSEYKHRLVNSDEGQQYAENVRALVFDNRDAGTDGYVDKTDEELEDIINEILLSNRYSQRSRFAINNGVAANRQKIKQFNPGEEYLFAVSLGKFEEGTEGPDYEREITYGAKVPNEYYRFYDAAEHNSFIYRAVKKAKEQTDKSLASDPLHYYLQHPGYADTYNKRYNLEVSNAKEYYESRYLFGINSVKSNSKEYQRSGGKKYRELFLQYLRGHTDDKVPKDKTFYYNGEKIKICEYIAQQLWNYYNNSIAGTLPEKDAKKSYTNLIYDIFIDGKTYAPNPISPEKSQWYYQGMYPSMVMATMLEAQEEQKKLFTVNSYWEPMGYDKGQFPEFDDVVTQDIVTINSSFNERLCAAFYSGLKEFCLTPEGNVYVWNTEVFSKWADESKADGFNLETAAEEIEELFKVIYKIAYEEGKFLKAYEAAKDYKEGGAIYLAHEARWIAEAQRLAKEEADSTYDLAELFTCPEVITVIYEDEKEGVNTSHQNEYLYIKEMNEYIEDQENVFKSTYNIDQIGSAEYNKAYNKELLIWIEEFLREKEQIPEEDELKENQYYYLNFFPIFKSYWVSEQEIGTYVLAEDTYELNGGRLGVVEGDETEEVGKIKTPIWQPGKITADQARHFEQGLFITYNNDKAEYAAIKTDYNPYLATDTNKDISEKEAGGYVFDRNAEVIRLFDPEQDLLGATYKPIKSDDGDYIFDVFEQVYRPFRDWSIEEKRHPLTLELDEDLGLYGDVIEHPIKAFDGHLGRWREEPTKYRMVRLREDPINTLNDDGSLKYKYLNTETTFYEIGSYKGEQYPYEVTYPAGYQLDAYTKEKRGKYVKASDIKKPKNKSLWIRLFGSEAFFKLFGETEEETITTDKLIDKNNKTFIEKVKGWLNLTNGIDGKEDATNQDDLTGITENTDSGLLISNTSKSTTDDYDEDRTSIKLYNVGDGYISVPQVDDIENAVETQNAIDRGIVSKTDEVTPQEAERYVKYKGWYWRHWGKDRYDYQPKICVQQYDNGVVTYKPFNKIEDVKSDDYKVVPVDNIEEGEVVAFYLKAPTQKFRTAQELDYGTRKYRMDLQDKKDKTYWVESPNGEAYLRHYKRGDGEIKLWDGHFGRWVDCFKQFLVDAEYTWDEDWIENDSRYPGLKVLYKEEEGEIVEDKDGQPVVKIASLPEFYLPYQDIMIPWDGRIFGRVNRRFTRQREKLEEATKDSLYVLSDGVYITLADYWIDNGFTEKLDYSDLKISIISDFKYKADDFSIINLPNKDKREEILQFDLNNEPMGTIDLLVSKNPLTDKKIKERWVYWKASVNKGISLIEDPLRSFGVLFEYAPEKLDKDSLQTKNYPFLGMQMFRYIPYEKKELQTEHIDAFEKDKQVEIIIDEENAIVATTREQLLCNVINYIFHYGVYKENGSGSPIYPSSNNVVELLKFILRDETEERALFLEKFFTIHGYEYQSTLTKDNISILEKRINNNEDTEQVLKDYISIYRIEETPQIIPLFPGEAPDAKDLIRRNYFIYNPDEVTDVKNVIYDYVGTDPFNIFEPSYDEKCQKIRSIKGKESNYFKLLQDCCNTFDCWVDPIINHDEESGKIQYIEKPVYTQIDLADGEEPQIYIGQNAKEEAIDNKIRWYEKRFGYNSNTSRIIKNIEYQIIQITYARDENGEVVKENGEPVIESIERDENVIVGITYTQKEGANLNSEELLELKELNRLVYLSLHLDCQYIKVPDKKIRFRRYVGEENYNGFKYGVNLKHIKRTVDSNQISTRVIVKTNKNEFAPDGFCTIQRAHDNPIKENFVLDFSYYIQQGLLKNSDLIGDLYTGVNTKLNYYNKLGRLNKDNDEIIDILSSLKIDLDNVNAKYQTAVLARDAAAEEISKLAITLTSSYDSYGQVVDTPWTRGKSQEYITKKQTSSPAMSFDTAVQLSNGEVLNVTIDVPKTATAVDYPKYNDSLRSLLDQMDIYQQTYADNDVLIEENLKPEKERIENEINELLEQQRIIAEKKNELNRLFYHKYSRYIQEGSWIDESYIDDNLYYLDALSVARTSSKPKITYEIGVVDLSVAVEYEEDKTVLESKLGDRTYVEDTEFFGYQSDGVTPYQEEVVVSEKIYYLDDPSQNQVKVKNYTTQFDDLFQRIAATSQTLQFNEGSFQRAAALIQEDGTLNADLLEKTIASSSFIIANSINEKVTQDNTGITVVSEKNRANVLKIVSRGILISNDGGNNYKTAITGDGINADLLVAGRIDTGMLLIGDKNNPNFFWDKLGISAFSIEDGKIDYSSFVRLDQYGIYGIRNYENPEDKTKLSFNNSFAPKSINEISNNPNAVFGLTWDGFFLNASNGTGKVTIGTNQDFKMSEYSASEKTWKDKVIIGRLDDNNGGQYYGFRLKNEDNEIVMDTNDRGELYLKNKLRISNFNDMESYYATEYVENGEPINYNDSIYTSYYYQYSIENGKKLKKYYLEDETIIKTEEVSTDWRDLISKPQDRVTLGIVDTYLRNYIKEEVDGEQKTKVVFSKQDIKGNYSSTNYLTKILSVKVNGFVGNEPFIDEHINELIENGETFAIFDNGNLYAKNAWIEGHINATSGSFSGHLEALTGYIGGISIVDEGLQSDGYGAFTGTGWRLSKDGTFELNNGIFHGTIQAEDGYILNAIYVGSTGTDNAENIVTIGTSLTVDVGTGNNKKTLKRIFSATNTNGLIIDTQTIETYLKQNPNETFAIFDNGQFHARNAYIKGHIEAESGKFTGEIEATTGKIGDILIANGGIQSKNYGQTDKDGNSLGWKISPDGNVEFNDGIFNGTINAAGGTIGGIDISSNYIGTTLDKGKGWQISSDGTAEFRNVSVSGKITSTIFEYDKVQTVAGSMLIRPAIYYIDYETFKSNDIEYIKILISSASLPEEFSVDETTSGKVRVKIGNQITTKDSILYNIIQEAEVPTYTWTKELEAEDNKTCILYLKNTNITNFSSDTIGKDKILLYMGKEDEEVIGLGLNASNNGTILPSESFSLISLKEDSYEAKVILGKIPNNVLSAFKGTDYVSEKPEYGLFADNVYLKGEIIATAGFIGDIIIQDGGLQSKNYNNTEGWRINSDGSVVFNNGIFGGTINVANGGKIGNILVENGGIQSENYLYEEVKNDDGEVIAVIREGWSVAPNGDSFFSNAVFEDCEVSGVINATNGKIGGLLIENNGLSSVDSLTGWKIDQSGNATFNNLFLNGKTIIYPSTIIQSISQNQNDKTVTIAFTTNSDLKTWKENLKSESVKLKISSNDLSKEETFVVACDDITFQSEEGKIILRDIETFNYNTNELLYFIPITDTLDCNYGIVINSGFSNIYPSKSISITEIYPTSDTRKTKLVLGYLDQNFLTDTNISKDIQGTYGLYCDNVWLQGNLIAISGTGIQAGVSTSGLVTFKVDNEEVEAVFFSGYQDETPKFAVSKDGFLYAQNGYFQGKIAASEIVGIGDDGYGLTFKDLQNAIRFVTGDNNEKIFELSSQKTVFYDSEIGDSKAEILNISSIGSTLNLFGKNNNYLLQISKNNANEVEFKYNNNPWLVFTENGVKINGNNNNSNIGDNAFFEDAYNSTNVYIGCNIVLR